MTRTAHQGDHPHRTRRLHATHHQRACSNAGFEDHPLDRDDPADPGGPCQCPEPQLAGRCHLPGHQHLDGECRLCHRPRLDTNGPPL